jgi:hypothetical protein
LRKSIRIIAAILCCLHLGGGNYGVLQAMAWTRMIVDYSMQDGLVEGAVKTFDGQHPCGMCKDIVTAKQKDSEKPKDERILVQDLVLKNFVASEIVTAKTPKSRDVPVIHQVHPVVWKTLGEARPSVPPPRALV